MRCKHIQQNATERKCADYYYSHGETKNGIFCRLKEWKRKKKVCPYDKEIFSTPHQIMKQIKDKKQRTLI